MPAADELDAFDDNPIAARQPAADDEQDPWGFNEQPAPKKETTTSKKKKKSKKDARKPRVDDGEDSSAYPKSITPSPPTDHGVKLRPASPPLPPPTRAQTAVVSPRLVDLVDHDTAVEHVDLEPPPPSKPAPKPAPIPSPSPVVLSPRPVAARPVPAVSPPSRPVSLYTAPARDRNNSLTAFRPTIPAPHYPQTRRESLNSQRPRFVEAPPPHMPQAHFFGLPDLGFNFNQKQDSGSPAGSEGYCCRMDSLADAGDDASAKKARDMLLVGCEGGLEVFRILPNKLEVVGRLEGLRGSVIDAKILPHTERFDRIQALRPLVAVIVHGPVVEDRMDSGPEGGDTEPTESDPPTHFQTCVEVFSLKSSLYVATLYKSPQVPVEQPVLGQVSSLPDPVGHLQLDATGEYITLSSGKSGEIFVFTQASFDRVEDTRFRCIGKFWTAVQKPLAAASRPPTAGDTTVACTREGPQKPVSSLSGRWLAIVPPYSSSSSMSIQGNPLMSEVNPSPPGITTHAAPPQPLITCEVVGSDIEGAWSRLGRQAAQGLVKYSQKGIEMGLQGWKELTQPSPPGGRPGHDRSTSKDELFPPTKAPSDDPNRLAKEPALVSIVDLDSLKHWEELRPKHPAPPMATFALVEGCNFLSLSSVGTRLVTVSRKGEVSTIWDLAQIAHGIAERGSPVDDSTSASQCVKQIQRIARNSPSTVLGCAWSKDDDAIGILTAHGTIHLHEVPSQPPPRKRKRTSTTTTSAPAPEKADATVSIQSGVSPPSKGGFFGSIKSSLASVSTQVNSIRSANPVSALGAPMTFAGFREATVAAGNAGGRAVARGLSQGYTAAKGGASDYWHADDNKIRHPKALQDPFSAKSMRWIRRNNTTSVAIACGGSVHIHPVQRATRRKGDDIVSGLKHERYAQKAFALPSITTRNEAGSSERCIGEGPHGFWSLRHSLPVPPSDSKPVWRPSSLLQWQSDVETNPPYCPFHVDASVNIYAFEEYDGGSQYVASTSLDKFQAKGHDVEDEIPWTFGESLPPSTKVNDAMPDDGSFDADDDDDYGDGDGLASQMESKLTIQPSRKNQGGEQIRINTRRRQGRARNVPGIDDGDFQLMEDDDDDSII